MEDEQPLTNELLLAAVKEMEGLQDRVEEYRMRFGQVYGNAASNLFKEVLEQRQIAREATEYAEALLASPDAPEIEE